jgi:hypothetical protein
MSTTTEQKRPEVNDLSLLTLLAAHEIERLRKDETADSYYVAMLRDKLAGQIPNPAENVKDLAPSAVRVYRNAVCKATQTDPQDFKRLGELLAPLFDKLGEVAKRPSQKLQAADLDKLLTFLTALHSQLLAQKYVAKRSRGHSRYRV